MQTRRPLLIVRWAAGEPDPSTHAALLSAAEPSTQTRVARLRRPADQYSILLAHALARVTAAPTLACLPAEVALERSCAFCGSTEHGRPTALSPSGRRRTVSISHTVKASHTALVAVAVGHDVAVGVDAEASMLSGEGDLDSMFTDREAAAMARDVTGLTGRTLWARKEALLKLAGVGLNGPVREIDVCDVPAGGGYVKGPCPGWLVDVDIGDWASVAAAVARPPASTDLAAMSCSMVAALFAGGRPPSVPGPYANLLTGSAQQRRSRREGRIDVSPT